MTLMHDLLSRLQAATEGSAELDRDVLLACGWTEAQFVAVGVQFQTWKPPSGQSMAWAPRPTRSLDDITRMIEEAGLYIAVIERQPASGEYWLALQTNGNPPTTADIRSIHIDLKLALVGALLRARATP